MFVCLLAHSVTDRFIAFFMFDGLSL